MHRRQRLARTTTAAAVLVAAALATAPAPLGAAPGAPTTGTSGATTGTGATTSVDALMARTGITRTSKPRSVVSVGTPTLRPGQRTSYTGVGLKPGAVSISLDGRTKLGTTKADRAGRVRGFLTVPRAAKKGRHSLVFVSGKIKLTVAIAVVAMPAMPVPAPRTPTIPAVSAPVPTAPTTDQPPAPTVPAEPAAPAQTTSPTVPVQSPVPTVRVTRTYAYAYTAVENGVSHPAQVSGTEYSDGTVVESVSWDGAYHHTDTYATDGTVTTTYPDGHHVVSYPDGSSDVYAVDGTVTHRPAPSAHTTTPPAALGHYAFLYSNGYGGGHWNGCHVVTYRVNPTALPPGFMTDLATALSKIHDVTGLSFQYLGASSYVPWGNGSGTIPAADADADLLVAAADPSESAQLTSSTIALGGSNYQVPSGREPQIYRGFYLFNTQYDSLADGFAPGVDSKGYVMLHELGHVLGLDHVGDDPGEVMYPYINGASFDGGYASGDLAGLHALYANPCF
ncbi:matrixin [Motilibacter peucedani]|uniref:Matrixin n=1 Tax=Motilibacter peucedani TaxID=598650 RepID=A0A420XU95_9ACTN|nr:matrixin family metalloprotease [Motilibacter peucedani]RKS80404.1 matrixin [Motilibacter peucedani]